MRRLGGQPKRGLRILVNNYYEGMKGRLPGGHRAVDARLRRLLDLINAIGDLSDVQVRTGPPIFFVLIAMGQVLWDQWHRERAGVVQDRTGPLRKLEQCSRQTTICRRPLNGTSNYLLQEAAG